MGNILTSFCIGSGPGAAPFWFRRYRCIDSSYTCNYRLKSSRPGLGCFYQPAASAGSHSHPQTLPRFRKQAKSGSRLAERSKSIGHQCPDLQSCSPAQKLTQAFRAHQSHECFDFLTLPNSSHRVRQASQGWTAEKVRPPESYPCCTSFVHFSRKSPGVFQIRCHNADLFG